MKYTLSICLLMLVSCSKVEQRTTEFIGGTHVATYVWYGTFERDIVHAWYDPIHTVNDSLLKARRDEGKRIIEMLDRNNVKADDSK